VTYALTTNHVVFDGEERADIISSTPDRVELSTGGGVYEFDVARYGSVRHVDSQSTPTRLVEIARFPEVETDEDAGSLHAPMPGKIIRVDAQVDDVVSEGQILVVLEAMKMEHTIRAPHAGTVVRVGCRKGDQVEADAVLVVVEGEAATQPVDG
jgi:biotin carboxyl carrier protein